MATTSKLENIPRGLEGGQLHNWQTGGDWWRDRKTAGLGMDRPQGEMSHLQYKEAEGGST